MQLKFDINNKVKVKLTDKGREILQQRHVENMELFKKDLKDNPYEPKQTDDKGYAEFQLHELMAIFGGENMSLCAVLPFEIEILIDIEN